jgi:hypothetical protein
MRLPLEGTLLEKLRKIEALHAGTKVVAGHSEGRKSGRVSLGLSAFLAAARSLASLAR